VALGLSRTRALIMLSTSPSVIVTDLVAIRTPGAWHQAPIYGGFVTDVQLSKVILRLHEDFPKSQLWDVRFTVNRLLLRRMHDAISKAKAHERILFPSNRHAKPHSGVNRPSGRLDRKVASNFQQSLAVGRVTAQPPGDVPFIIFGP
jgi:helicase MOV-10